LFPLGCLLHVLTKVDVCSWTKWRRHMP
jgi:hypothetical protein